MRAILSPTLCGFRIQRRGEYSAELEARRIAIPPVPFCSDARREGFVG
jgi:hypothetical protein